MARICFPCFLILSQIFLKFHLAESNNTTQNHDCNDFPCGVLGNVGFPFTESSRPNCGLIKLDCGTKQNPTLDLYGKKYDVVEKESSFLRIVDRDLEKLLGNQSCQSFYKNFSFPYSPIISYEIYHNLTLFRCNFSNTQKIKSELPGDFESYNKCSSQEEGGFMVFYEGNPYNDNQDYGYAGNVQTPVGCSRIQLPIPLSSENRPSGEGPFGFVNATFLLELRISGYCFECHDRGGRCLVDHNNRFHCSKGALEDCFECHDKGGRCLVYHNNRFRCSKAARKLDHRLLLRIVLGTIASVIAILLAIFIVMFYKRRNFIRTKTNDKQRLENFLKTYGSLAPKRYSYSEVRKMTESLRNQLGQGGYGCVYKGKMDDGSCVAVKVLKDLEGDGEGFINEVVSISRTSHVNIVTLKGFCFDGRKRALIYEFMSNGSLEKFIYESKSSTSRQLEWKVLYDIAIGIARGLEYLHRGCNTRILHFDIKPHNILLDEDFCPKISDFGLAKLCMNKESIVSTFGARGTIGYIAPKFVCRSVGGVSYKLDVYSYGMMVLEMVGGRKNFDVGVIHESEIYFPHWVHTRLELDEELELSGITTEEENEYARKMIIVSLWCIQMNPAFRPSMSRVVEMLEGNLSNLEIPPKPYFSSPSTSEVSHVCQSPNETSPFTSNLA